MARTFDLKHQYINSTFTKPDRLLESITCDIDSSQINMQITYNEGMLIYLLLKCINAESSIEIGTFNGYSATWIAKALKHQGKLYCFEKRMDMVESYKHRLKNHELENKIEFIIGDACQTLENFHTPVDAIFIDADKSSYPIYLDHAFRLLKKGGILIADNVFLYGNVYGQGSKHVSDNSLKAMLDFNNTIASSASFESTIIPTEEGLLIARKIDY